MTIARGYVSFTHAVDTNSIDNTHINGSSYFQKFSKAERTITQYKGHSSVDTKVNPKIRIKYPHENIINFGRNFPSNFRGFWFVDKKITIVGPTDYKEHGPEMIMRKIRNFS